MAELETFMSPMHNHENYRTAVAHAKGFCMPYMGLILKDTMVLENAYKVFYCILLVLLCNPSLFRALLMG